MFEVLFVLISNTLVKLFSKLESTNFKFYSKAAIFFLTLLFYIVYKSGLD
jgi:hypothetical protein